MRLFMMSRTEPNDVQWAAVVGMVGFWFVVAAGDAASSPRDDAPSLYRVAQPGLGQLAFGVFFHPTVNYALGILSTVGLVCAQSVIGQNCVTSSAVPVFVDICFRASLALVQVAVSHSRVFIKLIKRLNDAALKTCLHDEPHMMNLRKCGNRWFRPAFGSEPSRTVF